MKNRIQNQDGFTMAEFAIVFMALAFLFAGVMGTRSLMESSRISNAQNLTTNSPVFNIDGLAFWVETSMETKNVTIGNNVDLLEDIGSNGLDLSQHASNKVPIYGESTILNGLKILEFDGNNACLGTNTINTIRYSLFIVLNADLAKNTDVIVQNGRLTGGWEINGSDISVGTRILTVTNGLTDRTIYENNIALTPPGTADIATVFDGSFTIGCGNGSNGFEGEIAEVIIFDRALFSYEITEIQNYLQKKYGLKFN